MSENIIYITFDNVTYEKFEHCTFKELQDYLNIFKERLNSENHSLNEEKRYQCRTLIDVFEICEVANIDIKIPLIDEVSICN